MEPTDPTTICEADQNRLIKVYERLCPNDFVTQDDPRRSLIAAEVLDVGLAPSLNDALKVIEWWRQPEEWAREFAISARRSVRQMKFIATKHEKTFSIKDCDDKIH